MRRAQPPRARDADRRRDHARAPARATASSSTARPPSRGEAIVQLYLVRALAPEGPRQAIVVSLIAPAAVARAPPRRSRLRDRQARAHPDHAADASPRLRRRRAAPAAPVRRQLVSGARKKSGGSSPVMVLQQRPRRILGPAAARGRKAAPCTSTPSSSQRTGPLSTQPNVRSRVIAVDAHVHVIVVRLGVARLAQHVGRAREHRRILARRGRLAKQQRREVVLDEDPLHLGVPDPR